jgi:hypothetical protein
MKRSRVILICIMLLCLAGAWISGDLVRQHAGVSDGVLARVCRATTGTGCGAALESRWSELTIPVPIPTRDFSTLVRRVKVPVAFLGLAYFVFMGVWFGLVGGPRRFGRPWHQLPLSIGYGSLSISVLFVGLMTVGASPWCLLCMAVHVINVLLVAAMWQLARQHSAVAETAVPPAPAPEQLARVTLTTREVLATLAVALAVVAGLWLYRHDNLMHRDERNRLLPFETLVTSLQRDTEFLQREFLAQPRHEIPLRETETIVDGRPRLVVFTDFQCPACYCNAQTIETGIVALFDGRIDVHLRHYPLCNDCNTNVDGSIHPQACAAARVAEAARLQGGEEAVRRMSELLFARSGELDDDVYRELADEIGLDPELLAVQMNSDQVHRLVGDDIALAHELGVTGTPAMFLDGRPVSELCNTFVFWRSYAKSHAGPAEIEVADAGATQTVR